MIQTHRNRKTTFRPRGPEALEDRSVPSTMGAPVHAEAAPTTTVQQKLLQVDAQITAAYSAFATSVFAAETTFFNSGGTGTSTLVSSVGSAIATLQGSLTTAVSGTINSSVLGLIQSQITGSIPGSLLSGMEEIINAATVGSTTGTVSPVSFGLMATAVSGEISSSFTTATVEAYLYATGPGTATGLNLAAYNVNANAVYTSFAKTVFGVESIMDDYAAVGLASPASFTRDAVQIVNAQVGGLVQGLSNLVINTSVASRVGVIQGQFNAAAPGSLIYDLDSLFGASASPDGSIAAARLPLLSAAVDAAISASYTSNAVEAYILATV